MKDRYFPQGRYFEDFRSGETIAHATPRTLSDGDVAVYQALYGGRNPLYSSAPFAHQLGYGDRPIENWLVLHIIFGKSVADISRHAMANLGYGEGAFERPVSVGDTLHAHSQIIGLRENKSAETGLVMVRTTGINQRHETVLSYVRWVMVKKRDVTAAAPPPVWPEIAPHVDAKALPIPEVDFAKWDITTTGSPRLFDAYAIGEKIAHGGGVTMEEAEHMMATRAYQNTAEVHFDALAQVHSRFGKRLIYGGHVISHMGAMSFNGLENLGSLAALNAGTHAAPVFAGDTLYGWSEVIDKATLGERKDVGALRLRQVMVKNRPADDFPHHDANGQKLPEVVLELDIWAYMARENFAPKRPPTTI